MHLIIGPNQEDNSKFGKLMEGFRNDCGLSRARASEKVNVSSEYIRLIERGERVPAYWKMPELFDAYGVKYTSRTGSLHCPTPLTEDGDIWIIDDYVLEFTSRIREARDQGSRKSDASLRQEKIGYIVSQIVVADDITLSKIQKLLS